MPKKPFYYLVFLLLSLVFNTQAQTQEGSDALITTLTQNLEGQSEGEKMVTIAKRLLGKPYLAFTLESPEEHLICRMDGFDCYTLVETVLALSKVATYQEPNLADFREMMTNLRYRDGEINGYTSRIHYFFEWTKHAEDLGFVEDLTPELGSPKPKPINFMSTHRQYYSAFKTNNKIWNDVKAMEANLADYDFYQLTPADLKRVADQIQSGDIIAFTSNINGLDVNHEAIAYRENGELKFIHASSELKKVVIADETILQYINRIKKHEGLMVLRVL
ncbi:DUF1460 domain-containing protein [Marinilongibacter aquaticus]|uniref:DUF1460 domain-containing protein n=1 Tax=Marinilongibacter aquaticus TaxID=2975157 RepID=UPI0021BDC48A|nr:DUF1460 domain-containing protein [Marinilongibacter aquaticus]UBM58980.1 DUF1460 domain-containing protein [Marinilongibacter aquaticus]